MSDPGRQPSGLEPGDTQVVRWRVSRYRRLQFFCAGAVLTYALAVLYASWYCADLGFHTVHGERQVVSVRDGSPMGQAGLQGGDVIVGINGKVPQSTVERAQALWGMQPGQRLTLLIERGAVRKEISATLSRTVPTASAAAFVLGVLLLGLGLFADRGRVAGHPQVFFRATLIYGVFLVGCFAFEVINHHWFLYVPWMVAVNLAGPVTCHQMLQFPLGPTELRRRVFALLYVPPLAVAWAVVFNHLVFLFGMPLRLHATLQLLGAISIGSLAALYMAIGALSRWKRLRENPDFDRTAAQWLRVGAVTMALPLCVGVAIALLEPTRFATTLYKPVVAVTICGGVLTVVLAMSRVPFGSLDILWRRSSGYVLATGIAVILYFATVTIFGGAVSFFSGGDFRSALAATLVAAILFGPIRVRLQRFVDQRFDRDRARARRLLREAAEEAATTLDVQVLEDQLVTRVKKAVSARAAILYLAVPNHTSWRRAAETGDHPFPALLTGGPLLQHIIAALRQRSTRLLLDGTVVIPIAVSEVEPAALLVVPDPDNGFDDEAKELLHTAGVNFAAAFVNARAHGRMSSLHTRLKREVELAEQRRLEIARLKERLDGENKSVLGSIVSRTGRAPVIGQGLKQTFELVHKVAMVESSVLVRGETGVGKELIARAVHAASARRDRPFVVVDCGAISPGLFESILFGHVKGAFTGAIKDTVGAFRAAHGGTIFLDEIGELPEDLQPKLLRVLQEREIQPVGGSETEAVDVRVIAGTNRDLAAEVEAGNFREDLLYRVRVVEIVVPPLRERLSDIEPLAEQFLAHAAERTGRAPKALAPDALGALLEYDWPGNVRELEHTLEAALVYSEGEEIRATDLPIFDRLFQQRGRSKINARVALGSEGGAPRAGLRQALEGLERERLLQALAEHDNNKTRTADALGISRGALLRRLKRYGLMS